MLGTVVIGFVATTQLISGAFAEPHFKVSQEYIEEIKSKATTWTPYEYEEHPFKNEGDLLKRTGLIIPASDITDSENPVGSIKKSMF